MDHFPIINTSSALTMSSREIAELTGKRHDHVLRDIRTMLVQLYGDDEVRSGLPDRDKMEVFFNKIGWGIDSPMLGDHRVKGVTVNRDARGYISEISLDYNHTMTLISGYSVNLRKAIIDKWQALEQQNSNVVFLVPQTLPEALRLAADLAEQVEEQKAQITVLMPKAEFHDKVAQAINCQTVREVAKIIGTGEKRLFAWLREQKLLMLNNEPYQRFVDSGHLKVVQKQYTDPHGESHIYRQTLITGKGLAYIQSRYAVAA